MFQMINRRQFSLAAGTAAIAGFPAVHAQSDKIILGQSAAFTGAAAQLGIQFHAGAKAYFDQLNAQGGIGGRSIEIKKLDDGYEPDRCAANTKALLDEDVFALFGYIGTPTSLVALPLATKSRTPFLAPFTGAMGLRTPLNRYAFHIRASYNDETALIVKQLHNVGLTRIAVFHQNDAYGKAGLDGVTAALAALNLKPVATATVERNSVEVAKAVEVINAVQPEAVVQISAYKSCAAYIRAARKAGYGGGFYNVSFVGTQALADELGKEGAGVVVSQVVPSPYTSTKLISREFAELLKKTNGAVQANFSSMEGYIAARVVGEGLRRSGGKGGSEGLINALETINGQPFGGFNVNFSHTEHAASTFVELSMLVGDGRVRT
jgi:branched-chain amino acid transport system substrate-binding protein